MRHQYKNNKLKVIATAWENDFEFPNDSVSYIQGYFEYIIKNEIITYTSLVHICINRSSNRLVLKIKDGYKLKL